jgi:nucleotidyltransferase/DNA polymerase involved in DNA repair
MALLPVDEVWGVGRRISKKLEAMGIKTVLQLADTDIRFIRKHFNVVLERTVRELRGEPCLGLEEFAPVKQEIVCSRSLGGGFPPTMRCGRRYAATPHVQRRNSVVSISIAGLSQHSSKPAPLR